MAHKSTITAKQNLGASIASKVIAGITSFRVDLIAQMLFVVGSDGQTNEFDISANNTFTLTYASPNYTLTVS